MARGKVQSTLEPDRIHRSHLIVNAVWAIRIHASDLPRLAPFRLDPNIQIWPADPDQSPAEYWLRGSSSESTTEQSLRQVPAIARYHINSENLATPLGHRLPEPAAEVVREHEHRCVDVAPERVEVGDAARRDQQRDQYSETSVHSLSPYSIRQLSSAGIPGQTRRAPHCVAPVVTPT